MNEFAIEVKKLTKIFRDFVAVDDVSFTVKKGEIFGFLGANGAGKSTTIRMLCGLLSSTSGTATVAGFDINKEPDMIKANIGYMSQKFSLYDDLSVEENINFFGGIYGLDNKRIGIRKEWALEMAGLSDKKDRTTKELPGGWKQRLALGCALLHEPKIVFLDEPTGGVDPVSRRNFWELINLLSDQGITVFVTTHYLDEAEYCNNIMLIQSGKIVAGGSPKELKINYIKNPILEVTCDNPFKALEILTSKEMINDVSIFGINLHAGVNDEKDGIYYMTKELTDNGIKVDKISRIIPSLEDVFIHLIEDKSKD
jgi:ABC-2 type transport system ATP-binding protein